ncbi:GEVED domain-containing protein, partial [Corynebacterium sp. HS2168-gen11]|uniref:GEVED domain-containing protein n=1 Tax=Corynebacterium sp. HS2168-gen11 TaxID=2974027 RepID=UPI00216B0B68
MKKIGSQSIAALIAATMAFGGAVALPQTAHAISNLPSSRSPYAGAVDWLDWSQFKNPGQTTPVGIGTPLQVGATIEYSPFQGIDYQIVAEVVELKPFAATQHYVDRCNYWKDQPNSGVTAADCEIKDLKNTARYREIPASPLVQTNPRYQGVVQAERISNAGWSTLSNTGFYNLADRNAGAGLGGADKAGDVGVKIRISATFKGNPVNANIVVVDGESNDPDEFMLWHTNGTPWELFDRPKYPNDPFAHPFKLADNTTNGGGPGRDTRVRLNNNNEVVRDAYPTKVWLAPDQVSGGIGTQLAGPFNSGGTRPRDPNADPVVLLTKGANELEFFLNTVGGQTTMVGFLLADIGDAPDSYEDVDSVYTPAFHYRQANGIAGPYLGSNAPDAEAPYGQDNAGEWTRDDRVGFGDGRPGEGDEGLAQLVQGIAIPARPDGSKDFSNRAIIANGTDFNLKVKASKGSATSSLVRGWIDYNNNGKFDADERDAAADNGVVVNADDQEITLPFRNAAQQILRAQGNRNWVGARLRTVSGAQPEAIQQPTGNASSGEVEDVLLQIIYPPVGHRYTSTGLKTQTQQSDPIAPDAVGKQFKETFNSPLELTEDATIDATKQFQFVDPNDATQVLSGTTYEAAGEGTYELDTATGVITFTPDPNFSGTAKGVAIRSWDSNGLSTGWTSVRTELPNVNKAQTGATQTMDSVYIPTVTNILPVSENATATGYQGEDISGTPTFRGGNQGSTTVPEDQQVKVVLSQQNPAKLIDPATNAPTDAETVDAKVGDRVVGLYRINPETGEVTFEPTDKTYVGPVDPATVEARDTLNNAIRATFTPTILPITPTGSNVESIGIQGAIQQGTPSFQPGRATAPIVVEQTVLLNEDGTPAGPEGVTLRKPNGDLIGTYTIENGVVTFTPDKQYVGRPPAARVRAFDTNGTAVEATYRPEVTPVRPTITVPDTTGVQGQPQEGTPAPVVGDQRVPIDPASLKLKNTDGSEAGPEGVVATNAAGETVGKYTIANGKVVFTPNKDFVGTPRPAIVEIADANGTKATTTYQPTVTAVTPTATPATSSGLQGQPQTGSPEFTSPEPSVTIDKTTAVLIDPATDQPTTGPVTVRDAGGKEIGRYTIENGVVTFQPDPTFTGTPPAAIVEAADSNGTKVRTQYQPTVTAVTPTATPATSSGLQGQPQTGSPEFTSPEPSVTIDKTTAVLIDPATKQPTTGPVTVRDTSGKEIGRYTIENGVVTFQPDPSFTGTPPAAIVEAADSNGTKVRTEYQPTVTAVTPTATPAESTGPQGQAQQGTPTFTPGDPTVAIDSTKAKLIDPATGVATDQPVVVNDANGAKIGTYTIAGGVVTFQPVLTFTGTPPAAVVEAADANGTKVRTQYRPTVTAVTPTATPAASSGLQGQPQTGSPEFTSPEPSVTIDKTTAVLIDPATKQPATGPVVLRDASGKEIGTYTIENGVVTFQPDPSFTGMPPAAIVEAADSNGTKVRTEYQPTVTAVTPTATPAESTGPQGQAQQGTPTFTPGDPTVAIDATKAKLIDPTTGVATDQPVVVNDAKGAKIGTYTIENGVVTFQPDPSFSGKPPAAVVEAADANGTKIRTQYQPTVTAVTPTATPAESTGPQGKTQQGTPTFTPGDPTVTIDATKAKLIDPATDQPATGPVVLRDASGKEIGTYTIENGVVTFQPDPSFSGKPPAAVVEAADANGTKIRTQ